ncbi:COX15/CtaA family protein [Allorhizocola rhizosphaerae]|uniref:COX15/CtaA family protein n=1 Tax=Allorhizocola rhizosphaerae TaxID=1872709 RepID=UPI000E3D7349|nr:COX15/CtaA family protein [Allorhizocola rhizosphaerae]
MRKKLRQLTLANLVANVGIVITGGAVRLTGSGLGCPTWPKCTEDSYATTPALGVYGAIEFGNRVLSLVVGAIAILTLLAAWRTSHRRLAALVLGGVLLQGLVGGLTVTFDLSPYFVGPHFLISMALIAAAYRLWRSANPNPQLTEPRLRPLAWVVTVASALVLVVGVVVTGSGPHAGDDKAVRTGLDPEMISQLHVDSVFLFAGVTVAMWFAARALGSASVARAVVVLGVVLLSQGAIGFVQYFTGLPVILVGFHLLGACLVWIATLRTLDTTAPRPADLAPAEQHIAKPSELAGV